MARTSVYVTYLRGRREAVWRTLTQPEFVSAYVDGCLRHDDPDLGAVAREIDYPRLLILGRSDGAARAIFALEQEGDTVRLTVTHEIELVRNRAASSGWPGVLANLKSYLETGCVSGITSSGNPARA